MILQALYEYSLRKGGALLNDGFETAEIKYLIILKEDGSLSNIQSTIENKKGHLFSNLPMHVQRTSESKASLLWDNAEYVLALPKIISDTEQNYLEKQEKAISIAKEHNELFIKKIEELPVRIKENKEIKAVIAFYRTNRGNGFDLVSEHEIFDEIKNSKRANVSFRLEGSDRIVPEMDYIAEYVIEKNDEESTDDKKGICLITGKESTLSRIHSSIAIHGPRNTAKIVSFQDDSGYDSYGKKRSYNAPVSKKAEAAYTKALNHLIKSKENHFRIGEDTVVFWAAKRNDDYNLDDYFSLFFATDFDSDDPDRGVKAVKGLMSAIQTGKFNGELNSDFYILCLSPNVARISVRFWETGKASEFASRIKQHFDDFEIVKGPKEVEYLNLSRIISSIALERDMKKAPPNLIGAVMHSILKGLPYPETLLQQCLMRIRAEHKVNRERAAILKACLNRKNRFNGKISEEVFVSLDRNNKNKGYLLGRMFALLEKIQQDTHPGINATITDRYYGSASTNPGVVFTQLIRLSRHHLSSYTNTGLKINREKEMGEIFDNINSFPAHLSLEEQASFAIGYYHEKQSFFENKI